MAELNTTVTVGLTDELREAIAQAKRDRRERIATQMLAGLVSCNLLTDQAIAPYVNDAMKLADALIAALDAEADRG